MRTMESISIYIHIPLCVSKCAYCDFVSFPDRVAQKEEYVQAVCSEIRAQAAFFGRREVRTVFFGGGTPTLMTGEQVKRLMQTLREHFILKSDAEITMEGNPGTLTAEKLEAYREAGVNRISLGVQSFDDSLLSAIGRIHTAKQAEEAARLVRMTGFDHMNLDLMLGLPGQKTEQWARTLEKAIALEPEHLSCYSLILEEGTPLFERAEAGSCAPFPQEESQEDMEEITRRMTQAAGFAQYEVSNYARPGHECRHNLVYWECLPYLGVGCAAHSDMDGRRFYNPGNWEGYMRLISGGAEQRRQEGNASREERMFERMMMGLRMVRGVDTRRFKRDFGMTPEQRWPEVISRMTRLSLMEREGGRLRLTPRGMQVMNAVLVEMMEDA